VRTLDGLLRACGLQARVDLEPYLADVDAALDEALAGTAEVRPEDLRRFAGALNAAAVRWALDGATAVALQGLAVRQLFPCIAVVDEDATRAWLRAVWAKGPNRHGFSLAPHWEESPELVRLYVREPVWTRLGFVQLRFLDDLVPTVPVLVGDVVLPVLPLLEVERTAPQLADLLARLRQRRAAT